MALGDLKKKTEAQRLRAVLYRLWEENNDGFDDAEDYYVDRMEKFIKMCKGRLKDGKE